MKNSQQVKVWQCQFNFLAFLFDTGPLGTQGLKEIHADVTAARTGFELELAKRPHEHQVAVRQRFLRIFERIETAGVGPFLEPPIAVITVYLALLMLSNSTVRLKFLADFKGNLPTIALFLFDKLGIGYVNNSIIIDQINLETPLATQVSVALFLGESVLYPRNIKSEEGFLTVMLWFKLLDNLTSSYAEPYMVQQPPVYSPMVKGQLCPLYELWIYDGRIWKLKDGQFTHLTAPIQRAYLLIAVATSIHFRAHSGPLKPMDNGYNDAIMIREIWPTEQIFMEEFVAFILKGVEQFKRE